MYAYIHTYIYIYIYIHTYIHTYILTYIHTRTYMQYRYAVYKIHCTFCTVGNSSRAFRQTRYADIYRQYRRLNLHYACVVICNLWCIAAMYKIHRMYNASIYIERDIDMCIYRERARARERERERESVCVSQYAVYRCGHPNQRAGVPYRQRPPRCAGRVRETRAEGSTRSSGGRKQRPVR